VLSQRTDYEVETARNEVAPRRFSRMNRGNIPGFYYGRWNSLYKTVAWLIM